MNSVLENQRNQKNAILRDAPVIIADFLSSELLHYIIHSNYQFLNINFNHKWTVYGAIGNQVNAVRLVQVEREPK